MNVYRITRLMAGTTLIGAASYAEIAADISDEDNVTSIEDLGELTFLNEDTAKKTVGGRQATQAEIKASITETHLISFEDKKRYKSLKRHLAKHGLTIEQYRVKWGLPDTYPMIHPAYSVKRSELAKAFGLGRTK